MTEIFEHTSGPLFNWSDVPPKQPEPRKQSARLTLEEWRYIMNYKSDIQIATDAAQKHSEVVLLRKLEPERITITEAYTAKLTRADGTVEIRSG